MAQIRYTAVPIPAMNTTVGRTKRARSLNSPTLGVGPGCAQSAKAMAGTVAPKNESRADCRGANGNPPTDMTMAIISALKPMRTMKMRRMSFIPLMIRWPSRKAKGSGAKVSFMRMRSPTLRAAWLPPCMATATLACLSAMTSLTPSPIIAT